MSDRYPTSKLIALSHLRDLDGYAFGDDELDEPPLGPDVFQPGPDHWMLTMAVLLVLGITAALPSPLMVVAGMLTLCYLAPPEVLPAMLVISGVVSISLLLLLPAL